MNVLITGAKGQLAQEFQEFFRKRDLYNVIALERERLDISHMDEVIKAFSFFKPSIVINCAAYNNVDLAEKEKDKAFNTNSTGVKNLAIACEERGSLLIHYSTDYVFDGKKEDYYLEDDSPNPINVYGESKLEGERYILEITKNFLLFRVSWVYGPGRQNFLYKIIEWSKNNNTLRIVCDQISSPTYTEDIVIFTYLSIEKGLRGLYHLSSRGYCSRYELARFFLESIGWDGMILPVKSDFFLSDAKRPYFSAMSSKKISNALGVEIPDWRNGISRFIKKELGNLWKR